MVELFSYQFSKRRSFTFSCYILSYWPKCTVLGFRHHLTFFYWSYQPYDILSFSDVFAMTLSNEMNHLMNPQHCFHQHMTVFYPAHILQKSMWPSQESIKCISEISLVFFDSSFQKCYSIWRLAGHTFLKWTIAGSWWLLFSSWNVNKWPRQQNN